MEGTPDIWTAFRWLAERAERDPALKLHKVEYEPGYDATVHLLVDQESVDDWYAYAGTVEEEWHKQFGTLVEDIYLTPFPLKKWMPDYEAHRPTPN